MELLREKYDIRIDDLEEFTRIQVREDENQENGRSVCNGIVSIARNILSRVGVSTRELLSGTHSFLLAEIEEGNIITDPTWDLKNNFQKY